MRKPNFSFHKTRWGISKSQGVDCRWFFSLPSSLAPAPIVFFVVLSSAFVQLNLFMNHKRKNTPKKRKTQANKKTQPAKQAIFKG